MTTKEEIISILGDDHTTPAVFNTTTLETSAIYTYENDVFCLKNGWDFPFDDLSPKAQIDILTELKAKAFVFDNTFQG